MQYRILRIFFILFVLIVMASCATHKPKHAVKYQPAIVHVNKADYLENNPCELNQDQWNLIEESLTWLGTPYEYAGDKKGKGTDCSGMTLRLYMDVLGIPIPRNSAKQAEACKVIDKVDLVPGDLVFFATGKDQNRISHVGMMLTNEEFIHASSSKGVVINSLYTPYYTRTYIVGGRVRK